MENKNAEPLSHTFKMVLDRGGDKNNVSQEYCRRDDHHDWGGDIQQEDWCGDYPHVGCAGDKHEQ